MSRDYITAVVKECWELRRGGRLREAELKLYEALEDYPGNDLLEANLADVLLRQGDTYKARDIALRVLERNPRQIMALTVLGEAALKQGEAEEALENLNRAYELSPSSYRAGRLAAACKFAGREEQALQILKSALQEAPEDKYLQKQYTLLKESLKKQGTHPSTFESPEGEYEQDEHEGYPGEPDPFPRVSPGDKEVKTWRSDTEQETFLKDETSFAYAQHIKEQLKHLEPEKAAVELKKLIKVGSRKENPHLQVLLGELLRHVQYDWEAAEAYKKARELNPEDKFALTQETYCYRRLGKKEDAWPLLKTLLYRSPQDKVARSVFLKDAEELNRVDEAVEFVSQLLDKYPHRGELYGLIKKLQKRKKQSEE